MAVVERQEHYEVPSLFVHGNIVQLTRAAGGEISDGFSGSGLLTSDRNVKVDIRSVNSAALFSGADSGPE